MNMLGQFSAATYQALSSIKAVEASNAELAKAHADLLFSNEKLKEQVADRTRVGRGLELLWETARILLISDNADAIIPSLLDKVGQHLELDSFNVSVRPRPRRAEPPDLIRRKGSVTEALFDTLIHGAGLQKESLF